ncbi:MAG: hypothetical protein QXE96_00900 [Candidatus Caldarchaeum sp.]
MGSLPALERSTPAGDTQPDDIQTTIRRFAKGVFGANSRGGAWCLLHLFHLGAMEAFRWIGSKALWRRQMINEVFAMILGGIIPSFGRPGHSGAAG